VRPVIFYFVILVEKKFYFNIEYDRFLFLAFTAIFNEPPYLPSHMPCDFFILLRTSRIISLFFGEHGRINHVNRASSRLMYH